RCTTILIASGQFPVTRSHVLSFEQFQAYTDLVREYRESEEAYRLFLAERREQEKVHLDRRRLLQGRIKMLLRSYGYNGWHKKWPWTPHGAPAPRVRDRVSRSGPRVEAGTGAAEGNG